MITAAVFFNRKRLMTVGNALLEMFDEVPGTASDGIRSPAAISQDSLKTPVGTPARIFTEKKVTSY